MSGYGVLFQDGRGIRGDKPRGSLGRVLRMP